MWLSYTQLDLSEHADAVVRALEGMGWVGVRAAGMPASDRPMLQAIRSAIAECDALVAIIAHRYGRVPSVEEGGDGKSSWVWLEVLEAEKNRIPVLVFMLDDRVSWPTELVDRDENAGRLREFKSYFAGRKVYSSFSSMEELTARVGAALDRVRLELLQKDPRGMPAAAGSGLPPPVATAAGSAPSAQRPWFDGGADPLLLAWRLVVDRKADPDLLLHLDPLRMLDAIEKAEREMSQPGPSPLDALLKQLEARQGGLAPNALWVAWMRQVHTSRIEALTKEPPRPPVQANQAFTANEAPAANQAPDDAPAPGRARPAPGRPLPSGKKKK